MMAHYQDAEEFHFNISSVVSRFSEHSEENSHTLLIINIQVLPLKCLKSSAGVTNLLSFGAKSWHCWLLSHYQCMTHLVSRVVGFVPSLDTSNLILNGERCSFWWSVLLQYIRSMLLWWLTSEHYTMKKHARLMVPVSAQDTLAKECFNLSSFTSCLLKKHLKKVQKSFVCPAPLWLPRPLLTSSGED